MPSSGKAPASAKATADALAAAVRAVETGERTAASFFNDAPRPAPRPAPQTTPAARPREDRPDTAGRAPQQGASRLRPGGRPARHRIRRRRSGRCPVTDTGAMSPAAAPAPAGPAPAPRPPWPRPPASRAYGRSSRRAARPRRWRSPPRKCSGSGRPRH
ncbi:hypothetical protein O1L68_33165 [Streptomyces lydicus]|nr:hypothetical protein [Streptomyces lydicus]